MPIIESLLDSDIYKLFMGQTYLHQFPNVEGEFAFKCRTPGIDFSPIHRRVQQEIASLSSLSYKSDELDWLESLGHFKKDYLYYLKMFRLDPDMIRVGLLSDGSLDIRARGPIMMSSSFEIYVLSIVSECWYAHLETIGELEYEQVFNEGDWALDALMRDVRNGPSGFKFTDYGTRRRFSVAWHRHVVKRLVLEIGDSLAGTSNMLLAKEFGIKPIGTMAHEYLQVGQAMPCQLVDSVKHMLEAWVHEYRGDLGTALSDVVGIDSFLVDFDLYFAKLFDGIRQDSGVPSEVAQKIIDHYIKLNINPKTKHIVFSDGLTVRKAIDLYIEFNEVIQTFFGVGTALTNIPSAVLILQLVMKLVMCNGKPVAKIPDTPGKGMCESAGHEAYLRMVNEEKVRRYKEIGK